MRIRTIGVVAGSLASATTLLAAAPALAQQDTTVDVSAVEELEEVVVTARRREERLQDVPVAVTVMSAERLQEAQVTTARQLVALVPSLNINTGNQRDLQRFTLRGQGATLGAGEGVGVYVAEAPVPQAVAGGPGLYYDLENLQVLNGPQGTLFGRNTTGGAVLFTPKRPTNRNEGFIQLGIGDYSNRELTGALNLAVIPDKLSARFAGEVRERDGYTRSVSDGSEYDDINYLSYRLGLRFTPTDNLENYLLLSYNRSSTGGTGFVLTDLNTSSLAFTRYGQTLTDELAAASARGVRFTNGDAEHWWYAKTFSAINTTTLDLPFNIKLKNIASFTRAHTSGGFDQDGTPAPVVGFIRESASGQTSAQGLSRTEYLTEELQFSGSLLDDNLTWIAGGFYQHYYPYGYEVIHQIQFGSPSRVAAAEKGQTTAWFAQTSFDFGALSETLDGLKLTAGYRSTSDSKTYEIQNWNPDTLACTGQAGLSYPNCTRQFAAEWSAPTYLLGLDYKINDDTLVYASYRTGYKGGGFNSGADPSFAFSVFGPERVEDYEIGLKTDFHVGATPVRMNLAAFMDDYSAVQRSQQFIVPGSNPPRFVNVVGNSAAATIKGFEAQLNFKLFQRVGVDLNYSYLDTHYDNSVAVAFITEGTPLPYAPTHKIGGQVKYDLPVDPALGDISVYFSASYQSEYRWGDRDQPGNILGNYGLYNLGANWRNINGSPLDLEFYATNLFDKAYKAGSLAYYYSVGLSTASYTEPRMVGLRLRYSFDDLGGK